MLRRLVIPLATVALVCSAFVAAGLGTAGAASFTANGWTTNGSASPASVVQGQTVTLGATVKAANASTGVTVAVEVYGPNGNRNTRKTFGTQSWTAGQTRTYSTTWATPSTNSGTFTERVVVSKGTTILHTNLNAATITVTKPTTTTQPATTTTTTVPSTTTTVPTQSGACVANAAYCETFDAPYTGVKTQTGDLDPVVWGVSRLGTSNPSQGSMLNSIPPTHNACSPSVAAEPPGDIRVCSGRMVESMNDGGATTNLDTYPKQPFNIAGRTGHVAFDVSLNSHGTHGGWPEFIYTDKPLPGIRYSVGGIVPPHADNELGVTFDGCFNGRTCVGRVYLARGGSYSVADGSQDTLGDQIDAATLVHDGDVAKASDTPSPTMALNHVELFVSHDTLTVWASDPGGANFHQIAHVTGLNLSLSQGLVWMSDTHYNARKAMEPCECDPQFDWPFVWDNLSFDGPKTYQDRGFDVPYAHTAGCQSSRGDPAECEGYFLGDGATSSWTLPGVNWSQPPTGALVVFNIETIDNGGGQITASLNGHAQAPTPALDVPQTFEMRQSRFILLPASDAVQGPNTLTLHSVSGNMLVTNISLIMVNAAPVP